MICPGYVLMLRGVQQRGPCGSQVYIRVQKDRRALTIHGGLDETAVGWSGQSPVAAAAAAVAFGQRAGRRNVRSAETSQLPACLCKTCSAVSLIEYVVRSAAFASDGGSRKPPAPVLRNPTTSQYLEVRGKHLDKYIGTSSRQSVLEYDGACDFFPCSHIQVLV